MHDRKRHNVTRRRTSGVRMNVYALIVLGRNMTLHVKTYKYVTYTVRTVQHSTFACTYSVAKQICSITGRFVHVSCPVSHPATRACHIGWPIAPLPSATKQNVRRTPVWVWGTPHRNIERFFVF